MNAPPRSSDGEQNFAKETEYNKNTKSGHPPLTTKKFNLPESLMEELTVYANLHYQGNASQLIRAALNDHMLTLDGENEYEVKKLEAGITDLEERVDKLAETINESIVNQSTVRQQQPRSSQHPPNEAQSDTSGNSSLQTAIYKTLQNSDTSRLTLLELQTETESNIVQIDKSISELIDRGLIREVAEADQRTYEINSSK